MIWYAAPTPPEGFIECNGQSTAGYPALATITGSTVPDLRGQFIRGWSHNTSLDNGRTFASFQQATALSFAGNRTNDGSLSSGGFTNDITYSDGVLYSYVTGHGSATGGVGISYMQAVRPYNVALLPCIKY
ncbi:phage tail protein [Anaeromusa acidaminophila]|uniref:phage tail protein n=1 Tax=Anaeromusa acidaminophila TaxID=81464 RepID=UPI0008FBE096